MILVTFTAPAIYILVVLFSMWLAWMQSNNNRNIDIRPIIAILAGLLSCPLSAVFIQLGHLDLPSLNMSLYLLCITVFVGFFVGLGYLWLAKICLDKIVGASLFILGSSGGSMVCLYFYIFHSEVQDVLIGTAWGFLFGVMLYVILLGGRSGGIQTAFSDLIHKARRR